MLQSTDGVGVVVGVVEVGVSLVVGVGDSEEVVGICVVIGDLVLTAILVVVPTAQV